MRTATLGVMMLIVGFITSWESPGFARTKLTPAHVSIIIGNQSGFSAVIFKQSTVPANLTVNGGATPAAVTAAGGVAVNIGSSTAFSGIAQNTNTDFIVAYADAISTGPDKLVNTADDNTIVLGSNAVKLTINSGTSGATNILASGYALPTFAMHLPDVQREVAYASVGLLGLIGLMAASRRLV